jgi:predicted CXXCH cytochrome family protein
MRDPLTKAEVTTLKRFSLVFCLVLAASLAFAGSAFANFGPHGGYATDTDACAGCHRAHTSFSTVQFQPLVSGSTTPGAYPYALLVGNASTMEEFCFACHGDQAPGASTNVQSGVFDAGPSTASLAATDATHPYQTASTFNAPLNGGGFAQAAKNWDWETSATPVYAAVTSSHSMEQTNVLWGAGNGADTTMYLTCTSCHDPHGSSNYRLLKDNVNGVTVGGYPNGTDPDAFVYSAETNYPNSINGGTGWDKGALGASEMAIYKPDYTGGTKLLADPSGAKSISAWCSACHTDYDNASSSKNYGSYEATVGAQVRHRHPVNIQLTAGDAVLQIAAGNNATLDPRIPLELTAIGGVTDANSRENRLGCLTCHLAHGSSQTMTGWAAASLVSNNGNWTPQMDGVAGVNPDKADTAGGTTGTSALLRADNRGVCERCHNK